MCLYIYIYIYILLFFRYTYTPMGHVFHVSSHIVLSFRTDHIFQIVSFYESAQRSAHMLRYRPPHDSSPFSRFMKSSILRIYMYIYLLFVFALGFIYLYALECPICRRTSYCPFRTVHIFQIVFYESTQRSAHMLRHRAPHDSLRFLRLALPFSALLVNY